MLPQRGPRPAPASTTEQPQRKALLAVTVTTSILAAFALGVLVGRQQAAPPVVAEPAPTAKPSQEPDDRPESPTIEMIRPDGTPADPRALAEAEAPEPEPAAPAAQPPAPKEPVAAAPAPKPAPAAPARKSPEARDTAQASGIYTVQIAAFRDRESAQRLSLQLEAKGYDAYVQRSNVDGKGIWYRVRVGAFDSKDDAQKLARRIQASEGRSAYVTIR
ncbi:MAG: SPOR domain-containing protein [Candidatus Dadabacteria bacterium]|nr:MAG: SPOR domain-containing protein [Candidatus Dadabacteria bacterium]